MKLLISSMALASLFWIGFAMAPYGRSIEWAAPMAAITILALAIAGIAVWQQQRRQSFDSTCGSPEAGEMEAASGPIYGPSDTATRPYSGRGMASQRVRFQCCIRRGGGRLCDQAPVTIRERFRHDILGCFISGAKFGAVVACCVLAINVLRSV